MVQRLHQARERVSARVRRGESGFTLIELLIVIVILGVLAGIVVLAVGAFNERGEVAACKSDVKTVEVAVEAYRAKNNAYPANLAALVPDYLREVPSLESYGSATQGSNDYGRSYSPDDTKAYYIAYFAAAGGNGPSHAAGQVWGDLKDKSTHNCS